MELLKNSKVNWFLWLAFFKNSNQNSVRILSNNFCSRWLPLLFLSSNSWILIINFLFQYSLRILFGTLCIWSHGYLRWGYGSPNYCHFWNRSYYVDLWCGPIFGRLEIHVQFWADSFFWQNWMGNYSNLLVHYTNYTHCHFCHNLFLLGNTNLQRKCSLPRLGSWSGLVSDTGRCTSGM